MSEQKARRVLEGQVALVTGASSGIGRAAAEALAGAGCRLVLAARSVQRLEALAEQLSSTTEALVTPMNVTDGEQVGIAVQRALEHFGRIDILLNNAGIGKLDWLERLDARIGVERQLDVNLTGTILMSQAVLPSMQSQRSGTIINMGSTASYIATPTYSVYAASKFGVRGFSDALRRETRPWGIKVAVIYPGAVRTGFAADSVAKRRSGLTSPRALQLTPQKVAAAVVSLARRPRRSLIIPWTMRPLISLATLFPVLVDWATVRFFTLAERGDDLG